MEHGLQEPRPYQLFRVEKISPERGSDVREEVEGRGYLQVLSVGDRGRPGVHDLQARGRVRVVEPDLTLQAGWLSGRGGLPLSSTRDDDASAFESWRCCCCSCRACDAGVLRGTGEVVGEVAHLPRARRLISRSMAWRMKSVRASPSVSSLSTASAMPSGSFTSTGLAQSFGRPTLPPAGPGLSPLRTAATASSIALRASEADIRNHSPFTRQSRRSQCAKRSTGAASWGSTARVWHKDRVRADPVLSPRSRRSGRVARPILRRSPSPSITYRNMRFRYLLCLTVRSA